MDEKGLIFTTDAVLALAIFMVFSAAFISYYMVPGFAGQDQQSLDAIAADALRVMELDGTLTTASTYYAQNETAKGEQLLRESLDYLIPSSTGYKLTLGSNPAVEDNRGLLVANDVTSRVEVVSAPQEGWMGRAWYKLEKAEFDEQKVNVTTTLWNFHNWLTNFNPWGQSGQLYTYPYWGRGSTIQNIPFSVPQGSNITGAYFLIGSSAANNLDSYSANTVINGIPHMANRNEFIFLNYRPGTTTKMYNYRGIIDPDLLSPGINNYYVNFLDISYANRNRYNLPWFSIIGNYTTSFKVPKGVYHDRFNFTDAAGLAVPNPQDLSGNGIANEYGRVYDLNTGIVSSFTNRRVMNWNTFVNNRNELDNFDDGTPFVITNLPNVDNTGHGSAVSVIQEFELPRPNVSPPIQILDATVTMNIYGGTDNAMVEVWDGSQWRTIFCSFNFDGVEYSALSDGYGNIPGTLYIPKTLLREGNNKVRITIWDHVPSNDYDFVGLVDCYTSVSYTKLPILWENFPFKSYQHSNNDYMQELQPPFTIREGAKEAYLFLGTGMDTRSVQVEILRGGTWVNLFPTNTTIPYYINLASQDAAGPKVFTTGNAGNYTLIPGNYRIRVRVRGPSNYWESGDNDGNAEIYSGTRVSILYPEFLENMWTVGYSSDADVAQQIARQKLEQALRESGIPIDYSLLRTEALYTGDLPNNIPVRLDLWRQ